MDLLKFITNRFFNVHDTMLHTHKRINHQHDLDEYSSDIDDESSCMLEEILLEEFEEDNTTMSSLSWNDRGNDEYRCHHHYLVLLHPYH